MLLPIKILILVALIKLVLATDKVMVCAAVYVGIAVLFSLAVGTPITRVAITAVVGFALAALYFFLLSRTQESGLFWVIAILGIVIGFV
jgi:hypothetical protein